MGETPPSANFIISVLYNFYEKLREVVSHYLKLYVFSKNPALATKYGDFIIFLVTLTVIYGLIEVLEGFKKFFRIILALGWGLLIILIVVNYLINK